VGLGFGNPEPGPNSGLAKARGLARAQARAYIPYMVIIADSFKRHWKLKKSVIEIVQIPSLTCFGNVYSKAENAANGMKKQQTMHDAV
jgi:hypothetical protein